MTIRKLHRVIGIALMLPFVAWAITGLIFFLKPGYTAAYELLNVKTYPLAQQVNVVSEPGWREFRYLRTVLGDHLLVRLDSGWKQLDPVTKQMRTASDAEVRALLKDAFSANPQRYGEVSVITDNTIRTNTGIEISLDWNRMSLQQKGKDTDRIDLFYRIHYLQWTGIKSVDRVVGLVGIGLVLVLTGLGGLLVFRRG
jgi:uncharacterized iron-regulated membrane protein